MASNPRIDDLRKRLEKEPGSRLFAQLAEELRKDGEFEEAIRIARAGLSRHPSYPSARMTLGRALFDTGDMAAAREELQTVLNGAPDNILASRLLAECLEGLGDLDAALDRYRATLALSPGDKHILARVRDLEATMQAPPRPMAAAAAVPATPAEARIPLAIVDEPMELETSPERPAPRVELAPIPLVETSAEFELETAYDAPGTQWRTDQRPDAAPASAPVAQTPLVVDDSTVGERTLVDEPAPTIDIKRSPAPSEPEPSFEYAFDTPVEAPAPPAAPPPPTALAPPAPPPPVPAPIALAPAPPAAAPAPPAPPPSAPVMPPLPEPVAVVAPPAPAWEAAAPGPPPAPAAREPPAPAPVPPAIEGELASPTLAELYLNQGFPEKAIEVYRRLLDVEPANARARARLAELQDLVAAPPAAPADPAAGAPPALAGEPSGSRDSDAARAARRQALERTIERLESLRAALQKGPR